MTQFCLLKSNEKFVDRTKMPQDKNTEELGFTFLDQSREICDLKECQKHLVDQLNESNAQKDSICRDLSRVKVSVFGVFKIFV